MEKKNTRKYFSKPLIKESLELLPLAVDISNSREFEFLLRQKLPQNSLVTRERYARYIANRYSKNGKVNIYLAKFLSLFDSQSSALEVLYFEMLLAEPVLISVAKDFLTAKLSEVCTNKEMEEFLKQVVPGKNVKEVRSAVCQALFTFGRLKKKKPGKYTVNLVDPNLPEFLYVLHRLFPEPGMYRVSQLLSSDELAGLLWSESRIKELLYKGWHDGYLLKVTEIDRFFHFSTKYGIEGFLEKLALENKSFECDEELKNSGKSINGGHS
ncbi:MAG: hypothetical protein ACTSPG_10340 [Candidatus Hodarchaeales archaeon]